MNREIALKTALTVVGILFLALAYPMVAMFRQDAAIAMMLSVYVTLGVFLLLAVRDPLANRTLILFTAWSSFAHAAVMGTQVMRHVVERNETIGVVALVIIGVAFLALAPSRHLADARIGNQLPVREAAAK